MLQGLLHGTGVGVLQGVVHGGTGGLQGVVHGGTGGLQGVPHGGTGGGVFASAFPVTDAQLLRIPAQILFTEAVATPPT